MRLSPIHVATLLLLGMLSPVCHAQDKSKMEDKPTTEASTTPIKALVVFTEYDGDKKTKILPYTLYIDAPDASDWKGPMTKLRVGSRVPVYTGSGQGQFTYLDVGTNIDARAVHTPEGRFRLGMSLERSWVEEHVSIPLTKAETAQTESSNGSFREPIVRTFRSDLELKLREGQVMESTMATDPLSGKVMKVEVSISVVK